MKSYCTQNQGICRTCSLVNYGLDCQNNPLIPEDLYWLAKDRITSLTFTPQEEDFILADWDNWTEHLTWLQTASRAEIQSWIDANNT